MRLVTGTGKHFHRPRRFFAEPGEPQTIYCVAWKAGVEVTPQEIRDQKLEPCGRCYTDRQRQKLREELR